MKKFLLAMLVLGAFAVGVYVGHLPITDVLLGAQAPAPTQTSGSDVPRGEESVSRVADGESSYQVSSNQLTSEQRDLLSKFGIDTNAITITPTMIACAEAKVGAARLAEIQAGATPTFSEGASLLACYR